jgi:integrase
MSDAFMDAARAAGVDKHFHDLRGTAATRFYLAGFTDREIAETLGWSEERVRRILDRYVRRDAMLRDRIDRMNRTRRER